MSLPELSTLLELPPPPGSTASGAGDVFVHNADVAKTFQEIADLLEIKGENTFRVRAYRNAARTIEGLASSVQTMIAEHQDLTELPCIGADLAGKIGEIVATGTCATREQLRHELPPALATLLSIPGLGPKRVKLLYQQRNIGSLEQLAVAARAGEIRTIRGFGPRAEQRILDAVEAQLSKSARFRIGTASELAQSFTRYLKAGDAHAEVEPAGSLRRMQDTIGDLDIVASSPRPAALLQRFVDFDGVAEVLSHGPTRASVLLRQGIQVDLRVVPASSFGSALQYFTGSKAHNIAMRRLAQERDLKLNEYGLFSAARRVAGETEADVFAALGMPYIAPELRENRGEIEAALAGQLPQLVTLADLRGDLHAHTKASDGKSSLREMALAAQRRGWSYLAITDHSRQLSIAHGLDSEAVDRQVAQIERINQELHGLTVLKGIEVDINEDGSLDLPDACLRQLDLVVGAVHSGFNLSRDRQTTRILRAMDHPCFTLLAHPSGRLLLEREPFDIDMPRVIAHARQRGCFLELNAQPHRLDLSDSYCLAAKKGGVLVSVNSDAHSRVDFDDLRFGIGQARRGWLEKSDVLNTRGLDELRTLLAATRL